MKPKKHLGQHFLTDKNIAKKIIKAIDVNICNNVLEIGPGKGMLTQLLLKIPAINLKCIEIDNECINYLKKNPETENIQLINGDFLKHDISSYFEDQFIVVGNFPYNISSQILFRIIENHSYVPLVVGMFQKEVAERITSLPGKKSYGILSVNIQSYYHGEVLFSTEGNVFFPQTKVKSAVVILKRKHKSELPSVTHSFFSEIIKTIFNQRRKMLRNSLRSFNITQYYELNKWNAKRPEQLNVMDFQEIALFLEKKHTKK